MIVPWKLPPIVALQKDLEVFFYRRFGPGWKGCLKRNGRAFNWKEGSIFAYYDFAVQLGFLQNNSHKVERNFSELASLALTLVHCGCFAGVNLTVADVIFRLCLPKPPKTIERDDVRPLTIKDLPPGIPRMLNPCNVLASALSVPVVERKNPPPAHVEPVGGHSTRDFAQSFGENI